MFYILVLLMVFIYIFATMGIEVFANHPLASGPEADPIFQAIIEENFSSLPQTILTLMQFIYMDDVSAVYKPLVELDYRVAVNISFPSSSPFPLC